jgi:uncharacterized membrane protein
MATATDIGAADESGERLRRRARTLYGRWAAVSAPARVVIGLVVAYVWIFGTLTWRQQSNYGTFGFDMGIYDQGIWLVSRFREPFVTVRGLNYFGHHFNPVTVLFVPAYWLGAGPHFLYVVETLWMAAGAIPVYLLGRDRLDNGWFGTALAGCYLLHPSLEWMNWWHFHPDTLIIAPLLFAWWFATRRRWRGFWVAVALALLAKEDASLAVIVLGLVVAWKYERRTGLLASAVGAAWFVLATKVVIPMANGGLAPLYAELFPGYGNSVFEIMKNMALHPARLWRSATATGPGSPVSYYGQMLGPVAFVALLGVPVLLVAAPQTLVNVVSGHSPTHDIRYHYSAIVVAGIFLATVEGIRRFPDTTARAFLVGLVVAASVAANATWSPSPLGVKYDTGIWAKPTPNGAVRDRAIALVPGDAGVSTVYNIVPHMTHRTHVFEWPNPWVVTNWGVPGSKPPREADVDYLVLDRSLLGTSEPLFESLTASTFRIVFDENGIVVAKRR